MSEQVKKSAGAVRQDGEGDVEERLQDMEGRGEEREEGTHKKVILKIR